MSTPPVAFILGFGGNIGTAVAAKFKREGFNVAVASRSLSPEAVENKYGYFGIKVDLATAEAITSAFEAVEKRFEIPPSVVIFNAVFRTENPGGANDPLSIPFDDYVKDLAISGFNAWKIAQLTLEGFKKLPPTQGRAFIATGNSSPWLPFPILQAPSLTAAKKILHNIVHVASAAYGPAGNRFYFASEVDEVGGFVIPPDAEDHADIYWKLYQEKEQGPWDVRFLKGGKPTQ